MSDDQHPYDDEPPPDYDDQPPPPTPPEPTSTRRTRTPPHDLDAEAALLGAQLLSTDARDTVAGIVAPGDYYRPNHQTIAAAIDQLVAAGEPVDPITVAAHLGPDDLARIGGTAALVTLQISGGAASSAPAYARVVAGHARHRRFIAAATQLADDAWTTRTPDRALVDHRARLDDLGTTLADGSHLRWADVGEVLDGDVTAVEADLLERTDGRCLFYAGMVNTLQAEPSAGKSWVACTTIAQVLAIGGTAVYLDWEDSPAGIIGRLLTLGCAPDAIRTRFRYARAEGSWGAAEHASAHKGITELNPDVVVIDGVADAMAHDGLDENDAGEWTDWANRVPRPIAWSTGAAVVMLDHVKKSSEKGDRYARGSGAKLAVIDGAAYVVKVLEPYSRHKAGRMGLIVAKDRHGSVGAIGETVAHIVVTPIAGGERTTMDVQPPPVGAGPGGTFMPTKLMVRVSHLLDDGPKTPATILAALGKSKAENVQTAIQHLIRLKHVEQRKGMGSTHMLVLVTPYHDGPVADPTAPPPTDAEADRQLSLVPPYDPADPSDPDNF